MIADEDGPLTAPEFEMLEWNQPVLKPNGKIEPPDIEHEYMLSSHGGGKDTVWPDAHEP